MNLQEYIDWMLDDCTTMDICREADATFRDTILCLSFLGLIGRADNRVSYIDNRCLRDSYRVDLCKTHLQSTYLQPWIGVPSLSRYCGGCRAAGGCPPRRGLGSVVSRLSWSHQGFFFRQHVGRICRSLSLSSSNFIAHCCASEQTAFRAVQGFIGRRSDAVINSQRGQRPRRVNFVQHFGRGGFV